MSSLEERLAAGRKTAGNRSRKPTETTEEPTPDVDTPEAEEELPELSETERYVPVHVAVARVMADLRAVGKEGQYAQGNTRYKYRGVDQVVNAIRPLLVRHGLLMIPTGCYTEYRDVERAGGGRSHECTCIMDYDLIGPKGDSLRVRAAGESLDTSDKSAAKAQSVAWRTALVQTFTVATEDTDPDELRIERGGGATAPKASSYVDEILNPNTPFRRLYQIRNELNTHSLWTTLVTNEVGDDETAGDLITRIGRERQERGEKP